MPTGASFIRQFILKHDLYNKDSIVSRELYHELHKEILKLNKDDVTCDCEKATNSDSCGDECKFNQDIVQWLKANGDKCDIFDIDIE